VRAEEQARSEHEGAVRTARLRARRDEARAARSRLQESQQDHEAVVAELEQAVRAAAVVPLARVAERDTWEAAASRLRLTAANDALVTASADPRTAACLRSTSTVTAQFDP